MEAEANPALTPLDALYWGIVTLTTVGYGDVLPTTPEGKAAAMVLMVLGISLYSAITATITSVLIAGRARADPVGHLERLARLAEDGAITPDESHRAKAMVLE